MNIDERRKRKRNWCRDNMSEMCRHAKIYRLTQKIIALQVYSNGTMKCSNCGYDKNIDALSINHINSRQKEDIKSRYLYTWIINNNFPSNLQVLCMNCQFIKRVNNDECRREWKYGHS